MSETDLIKAFLARGGQVISCPTRKPSRPSMEWVGYEYNCTPAQLQPIPEIGTVRGIARRSRLGARTVVVRTVAKSEGR